MYWLSYLMKTFENAIVGNTVLHVVSKLSLEEDRAAILCRAMGYS